MNILDIIYLLKQGHYEKFASAAIINPPLLLSVFKLLVREARATCSALNAVLVPGVGVPIHVLDLEDFAMVHALLVPEHAQGYVFGEPGSDLWKQAAEALKVMNADAKKQASASSILARDVLQGVMEGRVQYRDLPRKTGERSGLKRGAGQQLAHVDRPEQPVVIDDTVIVIGGGEELPEWTQMAETYELKDAQILAPAESGMAVTVICNFDALPEKRGSEIRVRVSEAGSALLARVRIAMATSVPVLLLVGMEVRMSDGRRRYPLKELQLPPDIRQCVNELMAQAELFPDD
jgi:hypothetical protein